MAIKRSISMPKTKRNWPSIMVKVAYASVAAAIVLVVFQFYLYGSRYSRVFNVDAISAVTLSNGQTYFGHLQKYGPGVVVLTDVYYLQTSDDQTTADTNTEETTTAEDTDSNIKLVKLVNDFHKPQDVLVVNTDQILFWQYLSSDSPILDAIDELNQ